MLAAALCVVGIIALPSIHESYRSRAVLTQRVQIDTAGAALFGDGTTPIGTPQLMIIDDPSAVLPGKSASGIRQVDDAYLQKHNIYPLQLKTVDYAVHWARRLFAAAFVLCAVAVFMARPRRTDVEELPDDRPLAS